MYMLHVHVQGHGHVSLRIESQVRQMRVKDISRRRLRADGTDPDEGRRSTTFVDMGKNDGGYDEWKTGYWEAELSEDASANTPSGAPRLSSAGFAIGGAGGYEELGDEEAPPSPHLPSGDDAHYRA